MKTTIIYWLLSLCIALGSSIGMPSRAQNTTRFLETLISEELPPAIAREPYAAALARTGAEPEPEVIRERYDNGRVKVERQVVQDQDQNYINHGKWMMWDRQGNVLAEGAYDDNQRAGAWARVYRQRDTQVLTIAPFDQGQLPLTSQADFRDGKLDGKWIIYDANNRQLCEWNFTDGRRDGRSTWWYVNGTKMREINYSGGSIDGELSEWDRTGRQVKRDQFDDGRRLTNRVEDYRDGNRKSAGSVLYPRLVLEKADDWWNCTLATYTQEGRPEKHGKWITWYPHGQRKQEGHYEHDAPHGEFIWWHENGQKSLQANYQEGKKHGTWIWWHANGQKSIQGEYVNDDPSSEWLWWQTTGKVAQRADFSDSSQPQILAMPANADNLPHSPSATMPNALDRFLQ